MSSVKKIDQSLNEFRNAIETQQEIIVNQKGEWLVPGKWDKLVYWEHITNMFTFNYKVKNLKKITDLVIQQIDELSKEQYTSSTHNRFADHLKLAIAISEKSSRLLFSSNNSKFLKTSNLNLTRRIISLQYRMGTNVLINPNEVLLQDLLKKGEDWKKNQFVFQHKKPEKQKLSDVEKERIAVACRYENFAHILKNDSQLRAQFFKWIINYRLQTEIFVETPGIQEKISESAMAFRCGKKKAIVWVNEAGRKDVLLKCVIKENTEKKLLSLLDDNNKIAFADKYQLSVKDIYKIMAEKKKDIPGTLEMFEDGLHAWSVEEWGWVKSKEEVNPIDFKEVRWWEQLPVYKTISLEQAQKRFGPHMDGKNWSVVARASREADAYTVKNVHGFMHIVIPDVSEKSYRIYPVGEFIEKFPQNSIIQILHLLRTVKGKVHYIDQNVYYGQRQRFSHVVPVTANEGKALMDDVKKDINDEDIKFNYTGTHGTKISIYSRISSIIKLLISFFWKQEQRSNLKRPQIPSRGSPTNCSEFVYVKLARSITNYEFKNLYETELSNFQAPKGLIWLFQARGHLKAFHPVHLTKQLQDGRLPRICQRTLPTPKQL